MLEHGAYTMLLDHYYATEKPIPDSLCERIANARNGSEKAAVRSVLSQFFILEGGSWKNSKVVSVIEDSLLKSGKASQSAKARWDAEQAMRTHSECNADAMLATTPLATTPQEEQEQKNIGANAPIVPGKPATPSCPHQEIVNVYHELLPSLTRVREWTDSRQALLRKRWSESTDRQTLDWWRGFFEFVSQSDFLMGRAGERDGRAFECDLEWLVKPRNFMKVLEGKYENRRAA